MTRTYKRKPGTGRTDKRMAAAVRLRAEGLSLRQIGERLVCSYQTIANDLSRWEREHANVAQLSKTTVKNSPPGGQNLTPEFDSGTNVVELVFREPAR